MRASGANATLGPQLGIDLRPSAAASAAAHPQKSRTAAVHTGGKGPTNVATPARTNGTNDLPAAAHAPPSHHCKPLKIESRQMCRADLAGWARCPAGQQRPRQFKLSNRGVRDMQCFADRGAKDFGRPPADLDHLPSNASCDARVTKRSCACVRPLRPANGSGDAATAHILCVRASCPPLPCPRVHYRRRIVLHCSAPLSSLPCAAPLTLACNRLPLAITCTPSRGLRGRAGVVSHTHLRMTLASQASMPGI